MLHHYLHPVEAWPLLERRLQAYPVPKSSKLSVFRLSLSFARQIGIAPNFTPLAGAGDVDIAIPHGLGRIASPSPCSLLLKQGIEFQYCKRKKYICRSFRACNEPCTAQESAIYWGCILMTLVAGCFTSCSESKLHPLLLRTP